MYIMKPFKRFPPRPPAIKKPQIIGLTDEYKETIRKNAYLGKKGYTIPKGSLNPDDFEFLKKDLFMIPFTAGPTYGNTETTSFPVYRENAAKIYVPRFYGVKRYGLPDVSELSEGEDIDIDFVKELRDYQTNVVNIYLNYVANTNTNANTNTVTKEILKDLQGKTSLTKEDIETVFSLYDRVSQSSS